MERKQLPAGAIVFNQGEYSQEVYRIVSGHATVTISGQGGETLLLAELGPEDIFGEMAMIDESPRSATVIVTEETDLEVMEPADFTEMFFRNPAVLAPYLSCLIERLRTSNERVNDLTKQLHEVKNGAASGATRTPLKKSQSSLFGKGLIMVPKTSQAERTLTTPRVPISRYPYRIGRSGNSAGPDLLQKNDLSLINIDPSQVAKSHISIESENGAIWIRDRKTRRGTIVNGKRLHQDSGVLVCRLTHKINEIVLGDENSPAKFEIRMI